MKPADELRHLLGGASDIDVSGGAGLVEYLLVADDEASVLDRAREVLRTVLEQSVRTDRGDVWPGLDEWRRRLPGWFVDACAAEPEPARPVAWWAFWRRGTLATSNVSAGDTWSLSEWLFMLEPDERCWFWWDSEEGLSGGAVVLVEVNGWPYADGALRHLLSAAGAASVDTD